MRHRDERVAKQFGANLHRIRVREGLTQRGLAERASLHRTEIDKLESGKRTARVDTLFALAKAMAAPPGELIEGIEPDPPGLDRQAARQLGRVRARVGKARRSEG